MSSNPGSVRAYALDFYKKGDYSKAKEQLNFLLNAGFEPPSTHCHLARIALLTDDLSSARAHTEAAWELQRKAPAYVIPRILWLQLAIALMEITSPAPCTSNILLSRLKTALQTDDSQMEWTMDPVLAHLESKLSLDAHSLLAALVAALSNKANIADLNPFHAWRDSKTEALE